VLLICATVVERPGPRSNIAAIETMTGIRQHTANKMIHHRKSGRLEQSMKKKQPRICPDTSPKHSLADESPSKKQWEKGSTYELDSVSYPMSTTLVANDCS
jgi:hypothetical protein